MLSPLLASLGYELIRNAPLPGILMGILCPVVGTYLIVHRMTLLGNVITHAVLPGVAFAHFLKVDILSLTVGPAMTAYLLVNEYMTI